MSPDDLDDKPALQRSLRYRDTPESVAEFSFFLDPGTSEKTIRRRAEMVLAVDEGLGRIIATLEDEGVLDSTMIMFTSDNGFFFGEHWLSQERRLPYEESIRQPLIVRYPPLATPGSRIGGLAVSVDIAPTVLEVGGDSQSKGYRRYSSRIADIRTASRLPSQNICSCRHAVSHAVVAISGSPTIMFV
jgi:N-acetylglucosamine-6-sulfatase